MAFRDFARGVKNFFGPNNRFFNGSREDEPAEDYYPQQSAPAAPAYAQEPQQAPQYQQPQYQQPYPQQPAYQQAPQQYQQGYQQPQAQPVQYRTQAGYQQPMQPQGYGMDQQTVNQSYVQPRNRRSAQHAQPVENVVQFPGTPEQPQQPAEPQSAQKKQISACVINVRSIADCRSAIGILRTGDCVIAVMDSIADQVGFSSCYFSRVFKQTIQCNFVEYLTLQRLKRAQDQLISTAKSVRSSASGSARSKG